MGKVRKHRQACNNQAKKELFGIRTKLWYKNIFSENILATEMKKYTFMIKPVYLGLSVLEISKIDMCESLYDYVKPQHG